MKLQKEAIPFTYDRMMSSLEDLKAQYDAMEIGTLGESVMGRKIPLVALGKGQKSLLYVGTHSGTDWMCTVFLLRFLAEFLSYLEKGSQAFRYSIPYLFSARTIYIIPMLNPDGVEYVTNGVDEENILYDRVHAMNEESVDFSDWRGNARGVELSRNYAFGFSSYKQWEGRMGILGGGKSGFSGEMPESEPESAAICRFLRCHAGIRTVLSLHMGEGKILHTAGSKTVPRASSVGRAISRLTGYPLGCYDGWESMGGLSAWCIDELNIPAFSVACGNTAPESDDLRLYTVLREMLFTLPTMI